MVLLSVNRRNIYFTILLLEMKNTRHVILRGTLNKIHPRGRIYTSALSSDCCEFLLIQVTCIQLFCDIEIINDLMKKEE